MLPRHVQDVQRRHVRDFARRVARRGLQPVVQELVAAGLSVGTLTYYMNQMGLGDGQITSFFESLSKRKFEGAFGEAFGDEIPSKMSRIEDDTDDTMEGEPNNQVALRASESGGGGTKGGTTETRVLKLPKHFGMPEAVNQVLTNSIYFSVILPPDNTVAHTGAGSVNYEFRLTSTHDQSKTNIATPVPSAGWGAGLFNKPLPYFAPATSASWPAASGQSTFPTVNTDGLQWRKWFNTLYQYYRVVGCELIITVQNMGAFRNGDILIGSYVDTFSATNAANIHPANASTQEMEQWPDVQWMQALSGSDGSSYGTTATMKYHYYPNKVRQNVENDEDIKTWTKVGESPSLSEIMTLRFARGRFSERNSFYGCNVHIQVRKIVQFRDLVPKFRWPTAGSAVALDNTFALAE